jgi:hypothetical protein
MRGNFSVPLTTALGFFQKWTPDMAYVLGLLFADGCVVCRQGRPFQIHLELKDIEFLNSVAHVIDPALPVHTFCRADGRMTGKFQLCRQSIVDDCLAVGLKPRKSLTLEWPTGLPPELEADFVRGYFDGDGTVYGRHQLTAEGRPNGNLRRLSFACASLRFAASLCDVINSNTGARGQILSPYPTATRLEFIRAPEIRMIGEWMYRRLGLYLERKYETWKRVAGPE